MKRKKKAVMYYIVGSEKNHSWMADISFCGIAINKSVAPLFVKRKDAAAYAKWLDSKVTKVRVTTL